MRTRLESATVTAYSGCSPPALGRSRACTLQRGQSLALSARSSGRRPQQRPRQMGPRLADGRAPTRCHCTPCSEAVWAGAGGRPASVHPRRRTCGIAARAPRIDIPEATPRTGHTAARVPSSAHRRNAHTVHLRRRHNSLLQAYQIDELLNEGHIDASHEAHPQARQLTRGVGEHNVEATRRGCRRERCLARGLQAATRHRGRDRR